MSSGRERQERQENHKKERQERARHTRKGEPPVVAAAHGRLRKQAVMAELQQRELLVASGGRGGATHRRHRCVLLLNSCWTEPPFTAQLHATARRSSRVYSTHIRYFRAGKYLELNLSPINLHTVRMLKNADYWI